MKRKRLVLFDESGLSRERVRSLRLIIWAVAFGTICFNITGGIAMTGYLKALGVSDFLYGLLFAIGPAVGVVQIIGSLILERVGNRRAMFFIAGFASRVIWLPFGLVPFMVPLSAPTVRIWAVSLFLVVSALSNPFVNVSFFSLFADVTPVAIRGSYLGVRQRIATVMGILGGFLTAWLLDRLPGFDGYALVFSLAALFGSLDIALFFGVSFPPMQASAHKESAKAMLAQVFKHKPFLHMMAFVTIWSFSLNLSAQFYLIYIKTTLGLSNTVITLLAQIIPNLCSVLMLARWGRALDKHGPRSVMLTTARLSSISPVIWFFVLPALPGWAYIVLILPTFIMSGLFLCGMDIGIQNAFLNYSPDRNRSMFVALYFCVTSLAGVALANTAGGWLLDHPLRALEAAGFSLRGAAFSRYNYLFLLTFILRVVSAYCLLPRMLAQRRAPDTPGLPL